MKTHGMGAVAARGVGGMAVFTLVGLVACADTHWERTFYQGARQGSAQCQLRRKPADPPCAELLDYDHYARERTKARGAAPEEQVP